MVCSYCHVALRPAAAPPRPAPAGAAPASGKVAARVAGTVVLLAAAGAAVWLLVKKDPEPERPVMPLAVSREPVVAPAPRPEPPPEPAPPVTGKPVLQFGEEGAGPGMFTDARRIAVGQDGTIYVGEYSTGHIQVFDAAGGFKRMIELQPDALTKQLTLLGMATDFAGHLVVNRVGDILVLDPADGRVIRTIRGDYPETWYHGDLAIDASNRIHALTDRTGRVDLVVLDAKGKQIRRQKNVQAVHLAVDGNGGVFLSRGGDNQIDVLSPTGELAGRFGAAGPAPGQLSGQGAIATDGKGRILVDNHGGIDVFEKGGAFVTHLEVPGVRDFVVAGGHIYALSTGGVVAKYALSLPEP